MNTLSRKRLANPQKLRTATSRARLDSPSASIYNQLADSALFVTCIRDFRNSEIHTRIGDISPLLRSNDCQNGAVLVAYLSDFGNYVSVKSAHFDSKTWSGEQICSLFRYSNSF